VKAKNDDAQDYTGLPDKQQQANFLGKSNHPYEG
jgi:hypothetical protein